MVKQINGFNVPASDTGRTGNRGEVRGERSSSGSAPADVRGGASAGDTVRLSSEAMAVQAGRESVANLPDVNLQRVEEIRSALADGSYRVDDLVIADKLLDFDKLLD